jgi:hypothetical protein
MVKYRLINRLLKDINRNIKQLSARECIKTKLMEKEQSKPLALFIIFVSSIFFKLNLSFIL